jgi:uncharacterized protein YjeT (DUF2065 family)
MHISLVVFVVVVAVVVLEGVVIARFPSALRRHAKEAQEAMLVAATAATMIGNAMRRLPQSAVALVPKRLGGGGIALVLRDEKSDVAVAWMNIRPATPPAIWMVTAFGPGRRVPTAALQRAAADMVEAARRWEEERSGKTSAAVAAAAR